MKTKTSKGNMNIRFSPALSLKIREISKREGKPLTQVINELCYCTIALGELEHAGSGLKATSLPDRTLIQIPTKEVVDICADPTKVSKLSEIIKEAYLAYLRQCCARV
jgi:hypothetical protein